MLKISVKAARVNKGLRITEAAKELGISPSTLSTFENGKPNPRIDMLEKMAALYDIPVENLRAVKE